MAAPGLGRLNPGGTDPLDVNLALPGPALA